MDYEILSQNYDVTNYEFKNSKKLFKMISEQVKLKIFLLTNIWKYDLIYCWFADYHSFIPILFGKIFGKRTFLVLGGYDVSSIPSLNYGSYSKPIRAFCARNSMKMATINLAVSKYIRREALKITPNMNVELCYIGVDLRKFYPSLKIKENMILTVGNINSSQRLKIKGVDFFCEVASRMPEYKFVIVGMNDQMKNYLQNIPENLQIFQNIEHRELFRYYQKAKVYCQFSVVESFCVALAEAMLCECIGVVTNVGALAEVIGNDGFILKNKTLFTAEEIINEAMNSDLELGKKASKRIKENFSYKKREAKLIKLVNQEIGSEI